MAKKFTPKWIICTLESQSYRYRCNAVHEGELGESLQNTYRFNLGVPYLVKNQEDYDEMVALECFEDYVEPKEAPVSQPSETTKQKKLREAKEAKAAKEKAKKIKEAEKEAEKEKSEDPVVEENVADETVEAE